MCGEVKAWTVEYWYESYIARNQKRCKVCMKKWFFEHYKKPRTWGRNAIKNAKQRNKGKGVEVSITQEFIESIWPKDNLCPLRKTPLVIRPAKSNRGGGGGYDDSPSLHRKNPNKGYTEDNVVIISLLANRVITDANKKTLTTIANNMPEDWGKL